MKKKVLFALIALLSCLSTWATDVGTAAALREAFENATDGATITLTADIDLGDPSVMDNRLDVELGTNSVTLDLGGKTLTGRINLRKGKLTIKNGTVTATTQPLNVYGSTTLATNYSVLNIESDVTVNATGDAEHNNNGVCMMSTKKDNVHKCYGAVINLKGTVQTTNGDDSSGAVFVYGMIREGNGDNNVVNIEGTIESEDNAGLALNGVATVNVKDGASITGNTGISMKNGTLNVEDGATITGTGVGVANPIANNNGTEMTGAAVSLTPTYSQYGTMDVNIHGGTFIATGENAAALFIDGETGQKNYTNVPEVSIVDGDFQASISVGDIDGFNKKFIYGGTFSTDVSNNVAKGYAYASGNITSETTVILNVNSVTYAGVLETYCPQVVNVIVNGDALTDEWRVLGISDNGEIPEAPNSDVVTIMPPTHVGTWYMWVEIGEEGNAYYAYAPFEVTKGQISVDLKELHKKYGTADPELTYETINTWAELRGMGQTDKSITVIEGIQLDRKTLGEDAYDANGNQIPYIYSLLPTLKAYTTFKSQTYENYSVVVGQSSNLYIDKADLSVTVNVDDQKKTYGDADPNPFRYTAVDENDKAVTDITVQRQKPEGDDANGNPNSENVGSYPFYVAENPNYNVTITPANFVIEPKSISGFTVTFPALTYNGNEQTPEVTVVGGGKTLKANVDYTLSEWENNVNATTTLMKATVKITGIGNYKDAIEHKQFDIAKAAGKLIINNNSKVFGQTDPDPLAEVTFQGVNELETAEFAQVVIPDLTREAGEEVGTYAISFVAKTATAPNYTFDATTGYENGVFSITRDQITVVAEAKSKMFGEADPKLTWKVQSAPAGFNEKLLEGAVTITRPDAGTTEGENIGQHQITISGVNTLSDWTVVYEPAVLTITRASYYIVAQDKSKTYGQADPDLTLIVATRSGEGTEASPYVYTEVSTPGVPNNLRAYRTIYWGYDDAGSHEILVQRLGGWNNQQWQTVTSAWNDGNYTFTPVNGTFTIEKAQVTIKAEDKTKAYGDADPALTYTPTSMTTIHGNETVPANQFTITRVVGEDKGTYDIIIAPKTERIGNEDKVIPLGDVEHYGTGADNAFRNYEVTLEKGTFTIGNARLKFIAQQQGIHYGESIDPYAVTFVDGYGLKNDDKIEDVLYLEPTTTQVGTHTNGFKPTVTSANYDFVEAEDFTNNYLSISPLAEIPLGQKELTAKLNAINPDNTRTSLKAVLADHQGWEVKAILPKEHVPMRSNEWYSFVLPFDVRVRTLSNTLGWCAPNVLDTEKSAGSSIHFKLETYKIPANTPFIVKVDEPIFSTDLTELFTDPKFEGEVADPLDFADGISFDGVTIAPFEYETKNPGADETAEVQFIGVYEAQRIYASNEWYLNFKASEKDKPRMFYYPNATTGAPIYETEAYAVAPREAGANVRFYIQEADGTITTIDGVVTDADEAEFADGWYTVTGVKLTAEPTVSGTYIYNGKKVFFQAK